MSETQDKLLINSLTEDDSQGGIRVSQHSSDNEIVQPSVDEQTLMLRLEEILLRNSQRQSETQKTMELN